MSNTDHNPLMDGNVHAARFSDQLRPEDDADTRRFAACLDRLTPDALAQVELTITLVEKATRLGLYDDPRFNRKLEFFYRKIAGKKSREHGLYWKDQMLNYLFDRVRATETAQSSAGTG